MVDKDGSFKFSEVTVVNNSFRAYAGVFPDPAHTVLSVYYRKAAKGTFVKILSAGGTQLVSQKVNEGAMHIFKRLPPFFRYLPDGLEKSRRANDHPVC